MIINYSIPKLLNNCFYLVAKYKVNFSKNITVFIRQSLVYHLYTANFLPTSKNQ